MRLQFLILLSVCFAFQANRCTAQSIEWFRQFGGENVDAAQFVDTDWNGNVYVLGEFTGEAEIETQSGFDTISSHGGRDLVLAKYYSFGELAWVRTFGGPGMDRASDLAVDIEGTCYVMGSFEDSVDIDPGPGQQFLIEGTNANRFLARIAINGSLDWGMTMSGSTVNYYGNLEIANNHDLLVSGAFQDSLDLDPGLEEQWAYGMDGTDNPYVIRLDAAGSMIWGYHPTIMNQFASIELIDLDVSPEGNPIILGDFCGLTDFDPGPDSLLLHGGYLLQGCSSFFLELDSSGSPIWANHATLNNESIYQTHNGLVVAPDGDIYVFGNDHVLMTSLFRAQVLKFNSTGAHIWTQQLDGSIASFCPGLEVSEDKIFVHLKSLGESDLDPGPDTLAFTSDDFDTYLCEWTLHGELVWAHQFTGPLESGPQELQLHAQSLYACGAFESTCDFGMNSIPSVETSFGYFDGYVMKVDLDTITGMNEQLEMQEAVIYPNPTNGQFTLISESEGVLNIFDSSGRNVLQTFHFSGSQDFQLRLETGLYHLQLIAHAGRSVDLKFVVDR